MNPDAPQSDSAIAALREPALRDAAIALREDRFTDAERGLRRFLETAPDDVNALKMLAEVAIHFNCHADALEILKRCVALAPNFTTARYRYATLLFQLNHAERALSEIEVLLREDPQNFECLSLRAVALTRAGQRERSLECHKQLTHDHPDRPGVWLNYASDLKFAGHQSECIAVYRGAIARFPHLTEAYWSLGNLKTFRFKACELDAMKSELERPEISDRDRCLLYFTLGKAEEDAGAFSQSFDHYRAANALRRAAVSYDPDEATRAFSQLRETFTPAFLSRHASTGCAAPGPIFVVGLPRSGSTLIEQILSCHSAIETTAELANISAIADRLDGPYPAVLRDLDSDIFEALGEEFLDDTCALRPKARAFFVDKMPENFRHIGLIRLMLPNAKIIDARRHPLGCGVSIFRQDFELGYAFANDLSDIGHYYRDYVELMAHYDAVFPGKIHRIFYERMIAEPEKEIRCLFSYLGLPFEENCLRFHENDRTVHTASSEQVRRPIYSDAVEQWRNYEPWLEPLKAALGSVLTKYPVPPFTVSPRPAF